MANHIRIRLRLNADDPQPTDREDPARWPLRPASFFISILAHAGIVIALLFVPPVVQAGKPIDVSVYKMLHLQKEPLIYRAPVPAAIPSISPETPIGGSREFRGEEQSPTERIVVQQPNADSAKQLVWQPDKPEPLQAETPLQNMVAIKGKETPKPFEPPPVRPPAPEQPKALPAPGIQSTETVELPRTITGLTALPTAKPKPKTFIPPKDQPRLALAPGLVADLPPEMAQPQGKSLEDVGIAAGSGSPVRKPAPFVPPPSRSEGNGAGAARDIAAPPEIQARGTGSTVTVAVIGLNPAGKLTALPDGSRPAAFSRTPSTGKPSGGSPGDAPIIPGVAIDGSRQVASLAPLPVPPSVPGGTRSVEVRVPAAASTMSVPLRPASRSLPREIEARFTNRIVYTLVIPRPNFPEYATDWTIWFAERTASAMTASAIRAPVPVRKTISGERPAAAATNVAATWVQLTAIIGKDGKVGGIAPASNRNLVMAARVVEDLAKWEFRPAVRNGEAVEVEVVIEIPFRFQ